MSAIKEVIDVSEKLSSKVMPPKHGDDPTSWRWVMMTVVLLTFGLLVVHIALAKGARFGDFTLAPLARADEVDKKIRDAVSPIEEKVDVIDKRTIAILRLQYDPLIRAKVRERCNAENASEREDINQQINRILNEFRDATGKGYGPLPPCSDV